jgi:hypothetical protein
MENLVRKRELQLSKYGFKPTQVDLPSYPQFIPSKKLKSNQGDVAQKVNVILQKVSCDLNSQPNGMAVSSSTINDALIAKYTPAKQKASLVKLPEAAKLHSALLSQCSGDCGDKTYVISSTPDSVQIRHGLRENEPKNTKPTIEFEERLAKYSTQSKQNDIIAGGAVSSFESSQDMAKRIELYSNVPKPGTPSLTIAQSEPVAEAKNVKDIGSLLSKYNVKQDQLTSNPEQGVEETIDNLPSRASNSPLGLYTPPGVLQDKITKLSTVLSSEESFSVGLNPLTQLRQSMAFQDDDLERTVNVPHSLHKRPHLTHPMSVISTPEVMQRAEKKTPSCIIQDYRTPTIGGVSSEFSSKSENRTPEIKQSLHHPFTEQHNKTAKVNENFVNDENMDKNSGAAAETQQVTSVSSIVSKYSLKYNKTS